MKVETFVRKGKKSKLLLKVAESFEGNFSIFYTTSTPEREVLKELREVAGCPFIGCCTEGIIHNGKLIEGAGAISFSDVEAITAASNFASSVGKKLSHLNTGGAVILVNPKTRRISSALRKIYNYLSFNFAYAGGCGGFFRRINNVIFSDKGVSNICSAGMGVKMSVAFDHGWKVFTGPFILTKYRENRIYELDGKRALDVYCNSVNCCDDFDYCRQHHPLGFLCACGKYILRATIGYDRDGSIEVMSEVPHSSVAVVMSCESEDIINAAENAALKALSGVSNAEFALVFDCLSRKQLLGDKFREELKRIDEILEVPYLGMLSIGELASTEKVHVPNFHNKTVVVAVG